LSIESPRIPPFLSVHPTRKQRESKHRARNCKRRLPANRTASTRDQESPRRRLRRPDGYISSYSTVSGRSCSTPAGRRPFRGSALQTRRGDLLLPGTPRRRGLLHPRLRLHLCLVTPPCVHGLSCSSSPERLHSRGPGQLSILSRGSTDLDCCCLQQLVDSLRYQGPLAPTSLPLWSHSQCLSYNQV
jgi:hypothetical protein